MAKFAELNMQAWQEWVEGRPPQVKAMCEKWPPDRLYRMESTKQVVTIASYAESGTVRVNVLPEYNFCLFPLEVFGVDPNDLHECDIPAETFPTLVEPATPDS